MMPEELNKQNVEEVYNLTMDDISNILEGDRVNIDDVLDKNIIINDGVFQKSAYNEGNYVILQMEIDNKLFNLITGSKAIVRQLEENIKKMPFRCRIIKQRSLNSEYEYYTLAPPAVMR